MFTYTEFCRAMADWLMLPARIAATDFPRHCDERLYDLMHAKLPSAHFTVFGNCSNGQIYAAPVDLRLAIFNATAFTKPGSFIVFSLADVRPFLQDECEIFHMVIKFLNSMELRPVITTFYPKDLKERFGITDDDAVVVSHSLWYNDPGKMYAKLIDAVNFATGFQQSKLSNREINSVLQNPKNNKALLFSKKNDFKTVLNIIDAWALLILMYVFYRQIKNSFPTKKHRMS